MTEVFRQRLGARYSSSVARCPGRARPLSKTFTWNSKWGVALEAVKLHDAKLQPEVRHPGRSAGDPSTQVESAAATASTTVQQLSKGENGTAERAIGHYLLNSIMTAQSWERLRELAEAHTASFDHVRASALVCRLPKVVPYPSRLPPGEKARFNAFLRDISDMVSFRLSSFDPRGLANVLWAVSKLGYSPAPTLLNKFLFESYVRMHDFNAQELANLSWALATLAAMGNLPVPVWLRKFTQAAVPKVATLRPQEAAHMTWALSKLFPPLAATAPGPHATQPPTGSPAAATTRTGSAASSSKSEAKSLATAAPTASSNRSNSNADKSNSNTASTSESASEGSTTSGPASALPQLVAALAAHATAHMHHFRCGELVMTIMALQQLDPAAGTQLLRVALPHLLRVHSRNLSPQDLANLWLVLGKCAPQLPELHHVHLPPERRRRVKPSASASAATANDTDTEPQAALSGSGAAAAGSARTWERHVASRGAARLPGAMQGQALGRHHLFLLLELTERSLPGFTAQGLATTLVAWVRLQLQADPATAHALFLRYQQVLPQQSTFQGVAVTVWALGRLRLQPSAELMARLAWCAGLQAPMARTFQLVALLWGLQALMYRPSPEVVQRLTQRLEEVVWELLPQGVNIMVRAYTLFGVPLSPKMRDYAVEMATGLATQAAAAESSSQVRADAAAAVTAVVPLISLSGKAAAGAGRAGAMSAASMKAEAQARTVPLLSSKAPEQLSSAAVAASPQSEDKKKAHRQKQQPLWMHHPAGIVRLLATLAGVGMPLPMASSQPTFAMRCLQWRLGRDEERRQALRRGLERTMEHQLGVLSHDALCAFLISMARLSIQPSLAFMRVVHAELMVRANSLEPWHVGGLLCGLASLRCRPPADWLECVLPPLEPRLEQLTADQLVGVLLSLSKMHYRPPTGWLQSYLALCMARLDELQEPGLRVFLRGLSALRLKMRGEQCRRLQALVWRCKVRQWRWEAAREQREAELVRAEGEGKGRRPKQVGERKGRLPARYGAWGSGWGSTEEPDLSKQLCRVCTELDECLI